MDLNTYDKSEVLSKAMETFWHKGYESTSMKDLIASTGLTTRSMYNLFGSKNGLFQEALAWYYETIVRSQFEALKKGKGIAAIESFIMEITGIFDVSNGCLYTNTMSERYSIQMASMRMVDDFFDELTAVFIEKLTYAKQYEGYEEDPVIGAQFLVVIVQGMSVYSKKFKVREERRQALAGILGFLKRQMTDDR